jgi:hypothetical protein
VVQAATMIAQRSERVNAIAALDWYLMERLEQALKVDTPDINILLRFVDNPDQRSD